MDWPFLDWPMYLMQMHDHFIRLDGGDEAEVECTWNWKMSFRFEFSPALMQIDLLISETECRTAFAKDLHAHAKDSGTEITTGIDVHRH